MAVSILAKQNVPWHELQRVRTMEVFSQNIKPHNGKFKKENQKHYKHVLEYVPVRKANFTKIIKLTTNNPFHQIWNHSAVSELLAYSHWLWPAKVSCLTQRRG